MNSDPIAEMLTRIRNGGMAHRQRVDVPWSKLKERIAALLKQEQFVADYRVISGKTQGQSVIEIKLRYDPRHAPVILGLKRVSRPGLRQYRGWEEIPKVRRGLGVMIVSTSQGLMTDRHARKAHVGGELLCAVW